MGSQEFPSSRDNYPQQPSYYNQPTEEYQPPPYNPPPPPPTYYGPGPHNYRGWTLAAFVICYFAALIMSVIDTLAVQVTSPNGDTTSAGSGTGVVSVVGASLLIALVIFIIVKDRQSFFTLYGKLHWKRMNVFLKIMFGFLYLVCWIMTPIYIVMAIRHHLRVRQQTLGQSLQSGWRGFREKRTSTQIGLGLDCV